MADILTGLSLDENNMIQQIEVRLFYREKYNFKCNIGGQTKQM